jgi:protein tyrosine phosphatase
MMLSEYKLSTMQYNKTDQLIRRDIAMENLKTRERVIITHLQYIAWPDHGLPEHTDGFSKILDLVDSKNTNNAPIIVHCR